MSNNDKDKVSPRPWRETDFCRIEDAGEVSVNYIGEHDMANRAHIVYCVNTHDTIVESHAKLVKALEWALSRDRVDKRIDDTEGERYGLYIKHKTTLIRAKDVKP